MSSPLSIRQELFAREMAAGRSATAAARAAGYEPSNARSQGMRLMNTASIRERIEALQAAAEEARAARVARMESRLKLLFERALEKDDLRTAVACLRTEAQVTGLFPGRAAPLDVAPELVDTIDEYERFQARFPAPIKSNTSPGTASPAAIADTGEQLETVIEPCAESGDGPGQPSSVQAGKESWNAEEEFVPLSGTPEEWRVRFEGKTPWWVPEELPRDQVWDYVAGFMSDPGHLRGEEPYGDDPFAPSDGAGDPDDADESPTEADICRRAMPTPCAA